MNHFHSRISGWFDFPELYRQAVRECPDSGVMIEVGSYVGKSAAFMAVEIANSGKAIEFYCVDTWRMEDVPGVQGSGCTLPKFFRNLTPVIELVRPLNLPSVRAAKAFDDESVDFVFIDGDHSEESVRSDIEAWLPKVKQGGVIAGHDYTNNWPGVVAAVSQYFKSPEGRGSCWFVRKEGDVAQASS